MKKKAQPSFEAELRRLRKKIDQADEKLLKALAGRMKTVEKIGLLKSKSSQPVLQKSRWEKLLAERILTGKKEGLSERLSLRLFKLIHQEALQIQKQIPRRKNK